MTCRTARIFFFRRCQRDHLAFQSAVRLIRLDLRTLRPDFQLHQGFCYSPLEECKDAFRFAVLTDSNRLPQLIHDCAALVSEESFFVLEYYPDKVTLAQNDTPVEPTVFYSPYMPTEGDSQPD